MKAAPTAKAPSSPRKLLVIDPAYTFEMVLERGLEIPILSRDLDGFFEHVWSIHPFATLLTSDEWAPRYGRPATYSLAARHTIIEGKVGRFQSLKSLFVANFFLSQFDLFMQLLRLIRRERISAIRVTSPLYSGLFGWLLARLSRIPLIVHVGGNHDKIFETTGLPQEPRLMRSRKIEKLVERFIFRRADLVAGANQDNLNFALANGARPERTTLFRYGNLVHRNHLVDPKDRMIEGRAFEDFGIEANQFLLYVGRLETVKHPDHVIEVLAQVRKSGFDVKAVLAGDGSMREELISKAETLGVSNSVIMPGNLPQDVLAQLFSSAAAVVSPHTGRALAEAAFGAAPVAAYDLDWQGEIIKDGETGILVAHRDVHALANGVISLLVDRARARALGIALRERARAMLDPVKLDQHEREVFSRLFAEEAA